MLQKNTLLSIQRIPSTSKTTRWGQGILPLLQGDFVGRILNALCGVGYLVGTQLMMGLSVSVTEHWG